MNTLNYASKTMVIVGIIIAIVASSGISYFVASSVGVPGPQGPPGSQGLQGDTGLQGDIGPSWIEGKEWVELTTFQGITEEDTDTFTITGALWRIRWYARAEIPSLAFFGLILHKTGETRPQLILARYPDEFTDIESQGSYEYLIGTGTFSCELNPANLETWEIGVEVYQ